MTNSMPKTMQLTGNNVAAKVYGYLKSHPGVLIYAIDVVKETGLIDTSVHSALVRMAAIPAYHVYRVQRGVYVYHPNGEPPKVETVNPYIPTKPVATIAETGQLMPVAKPSEVWETIGQTNGLVIIRNESSELYVAVPLAKYLKD